MKIATIDEVNTLACCPCNLPTCDTPREECESKTVSRQACGKEPPGSVADLVTECPVILQFFRHYVRIDEFVFTSPAGTNRETRTIIYTRDAEGFCDFTDDIVHDPVFGGSLGTFVSATSTWSGGVYAHSETWTNGTSTTSVVYSDPETEATLTATVRGLMAAAEWEAGTCVSKKDYQHRAVAPCDESDPAVLPYLVALTDVRYRYGIPSGYTRSTWEMQWDEGFFPQAWLDWDSGGRIGAEPTRPTRLTARSWIYGGTDEWSDWFDLPAPDEAGEILRVNVMIKCWKSTRHGVKPTAFGPVFVFDP